MPHPPAAPSEPRSVGPAAPITLEALGLSPGTCPPPRQAIAAVRTQRGPMPPWIKAARAVLRSVSAHIGDKGLCNVTTREIELSVAALVVDPTAPPHAALRLCAWLGLFARSGPAAMDLCAAVFDALLLSIIGAHTTPKGSLAVGLKATAPPPPSLLGAPWTPLSLSLSQLRFQDPSTIRVITALCRPRSDADRWEQVGRVRALLAGFTANGVPACPPSVTALQNMPQSDPSGFLEGAAPHDSITVEDSIWTLINNCAELAVLTAPDGSLVLEETAAPAVAALIGALWAVPLSSVPRNVVQRSAAARPLLEQWVLKQAAESAPKPASPRRRRL